MTENLCDL